MNPLNQFTMKQEEIDLYYEEKTAKRDQQMVPISRILVIIVLVLILGWLFGL